MAPRRKDAWKNRGGNFEDDSNSQNASSPATSSNATSHSTTTSSARLSRYGAFKLNDSSNFGDDSSQAAANAQANPLLAQVQPTSVTASTSGQASPTIPSSSGPVENQPPAPEPPAESDSQAPSQSGSGEADVQTAAGEPTREQTGQEFQEEVSAEADLEGNASGNAAPSRRDQQNTSDGMGDLDPAQQLEGARAMSNEVARFISERRAAPATLDGHEGEVAAQAGFDRGGTPPSTSPSRGEAQGNLQTTVPDSQPARVQPSQQPPVRQQSPPQVLTRGQTLPESAASPLPGGDPRAELATTLPLNRRQWDENNRYFTHIAVYDAAARDRAPHRHPIVERSRGEDDDLPQGACGSCGVEDAGLCGHWDWCPKK